ncbi:hypothetical protein NOCA2300047 [metagenome]|uniref:Uncharacterized protein n=1 Tax=metagenome TaxID=256318 RepID=A0A2P2C1C5_9ZZZZ
MTSTTLTDSRHAVEEAFLAFLHDRLSEEVRAAARRHSAAESVSPVSERGLRLLDELVRGLENGEAPDHMSLGLLTVAYGDHPDFLPRWNRWTPED